LTTVKTVSSSSCDTCCR